MVFQSASIRCGWENLSKMVDSWWSEFRHCALKILRCKIHGQEVSDSYLAQGSSFVSSCTWRGVFAFTLGFSSEISCRIDGNSEVHPEGGIRTRTSQSCCDHLCCEDHDHHQSVGPRWNARCQPLFQVNQFQTSVFRA